MADLYAGLILVALGSFPFVLYPLILAVELGMRGGPPPPPRTLGDHLILSVLLTANDDDPALITRVQAILTALGGDSRHQVLVLAVSVGSSIIGQLSALDQRVTVLRPLARPNGNRAPMDLLISAARGDILVFADGLAAGSADFPRLLQRAFADPKTGCVFARRRFGSDTSLVANWASRLDRQIASRQGALGVLIPAPGTLLAVRRQEFTPAPPGLDPDLHACLWAHARDLRTVEIARLGILTAPMPQTFPQLRTELLHRSARTHRNMDTVVSFHTDLPRMTVRFLSHLIMREGMRWLAGWMWLLGLCLLASAVVTDPGDAPDKTMGLIIAALIAVSTVRPKWGKALAMVAAMFLARSWGIIEFALARLDPERHRK